MIRRSCFQNEILFAIFIIFLGFTVSLGIYTINSQNKFIASVKTDYLAAQINQVNKLPTLSQTSFTTQPNPDFIPIRDWSVPEISIDAKSFLIFDLEKKRVLAQKNIDEKLPIASLAKLMTAIAALDNIDSASKIKISKKAVETEGIAGGLVVGEELTVKDLIFIMLIESSNDAAFALSEYLGENKFVALMNKKTAEIGLKNTYFTGPSGLEDEGNFSTAQDLAKLTEYALSYPVIKEALATPEIDIKSIDGKFNHHLVSTNKLLGANPDVLAGKTGYTEAAGECLILVAKSPSKLIYIILGSKSRWEDAKKMIEWTNKAYIWE